MNHNALPPQCLYEVTRILCPQRYWTILVRNSIKANQVTVQTASADTAQNDVLDRHIISHGA